jgi:hypothetical protein
MRKMVGIKLHGLDHLTYFYSQDSGVLMEDSKQQSHGL